MPLSSQRLRQIAEQARTLAAAFGVKPRPPDLKELMQTMRGLLDMYAPNGELDDTLRDAVDDAARLGALKKNSEWLLAKAGALPGNDVPQVPARLSAIAETIEAAATALGASSQPERRAGLPETAERFNEWILTGGSLGHGGQGEVELVRHFRTLERGALKTMTGNRALTEKGRERFLREIEAFRKVRNPFVVSVLDAGESPEPFLVTELASFGSLHDNRVAFLRDPWRCLRLTRSVALGLAAAHQQGIIHRDIKPKNILLQSLDHPLVADFGIAHFADKDTITSIGSHPAAFKFAPPEYDNDEEPTPAFDVFSLGAVLHLALTNEEPTKPYRKLAQLPSIATPSDATKQALDELIAKMTQQEQSKRMQTMTDVVAAIDSVIARLFESGPTGPSACSCREGRFVDVGEFVLGSGTEINFYPSGGGNPGAQGLHSLGPRLERCTSCSALRLRATKPDTRPRT
jgi:protein kinase-like protein